MVPQRLAFLDWTRGAAVVIMIVCHSFNALVREKEIPAVMVKEKKKEEGARTERSSP